MDYRSSQRYVHTVVELILNPVAEYRFRYADIPVPRRSDMKGTAVFAVALVFSSGLLIAQNTGRTAAASSEKNILKIIQLPPANIGCTVGMLARHESGLHRVYVGNGATPEPSGMRLKFVLTSPRRDPITSANITIQGLNGKSHIIQTRDGAQSAEIQRSMSVNLVPGEDRNSDADLVAPGFVVVNSIELNSVTYASGSTWKVAGNQVCQVAPDPLMLTSAQMRR